MKEILDDNWKAVIELIRSNGGSTDIIWYFGNPSINSREATPDRKATGISAICKNGNEIESVNQLPVEVEKLATPHGNIDADGYSQWKI